MMVEYKKVKVDNSCVKEIIDALHNDVIFEKVISTENIIIKGAEVQNLLISNSSFKENLSFINCKFSGNVSILESKSESAISFTNCEINGSLSIYQTTIDNGFQLIKNNIKGNVTIDGMSCKLIDLDSLSSNKVVISSGESNCSITQLKIRNSNIHSSLTLSEIGDVHSLEVSNLSSPLLSIRHLETISKASLDVSNCVIDNFNLEVSKVSSESRFLVEKCTFVNLSLNNNKYDTCQISIENSLVTGILSIIGVKQTNSFFDISTSSHTNLNLDGNLIAFLDNNDISPLLQSEDYLSQRIETLKKLKTSFANDHHYDKEDKCFYMLKNEEAKLHFKESNFFNKIFSFFGYIICRFVLGWGVKIINPIFSAIFSIIIFSFYYYFSLNLYIQQNSVEYVGQNITGVYAGLTLSILSFFGQQADATIIGTIATYVFFIEFVFGMTITTLIIGVLIRKIVR